MVLAERENNSPPGSAVSQRELFESEIKTRAVCGGVELTLCPHERPRSHSCCALDLPDLDTGQGDVSRVNEQLGRSLLPINWQSNEIK